ncbi:MAG: hypothetical protein NVSMB9_22600 [Isosphaeraceae bacterium]
MKGIWNMSGWLISGPDGAEWEGWLEGIRLAANLMIVTSNLYIVWILFTHDRWRLAKLSAPWLFAVFAALIALCGASHLGALIVPQPPAQFGSTALRVLAATFWVVTAGRLPAIVVHFARPRRTSLAGAAALDTPPAGAVTPLETQRLGNVIARDVLIRDQITTIREFQEHLTEREVIQCKI